MRVCSICGQKNEDWMDICERCGNTIVNADVVSSPKNDYSYMLPTTSNTYEIEQEKPKEKKKIDNLDLKIIIIILLIILVGLIIYAFSI